MKHVCTFGPWHSALDQSFRRFQQLVDIGANTARSFLRTPEVFEDDANFFVRYEVPGVTKENLALKLEKRNLTLTVSRPGEGDTETRVSAVTLPDEADRSAIEAKLENGVLTVTLRKRAENQPRIIEIA